MIQRSQNKELLSVKDNHTYLIIMSFLGRHLLGLNLLRDLLSFSSHVVDKGGNGSVGWNSKGESAGEIDEGSTQSSPRTTLMLANETR